MHAVRDVSLVSNPLLHFAGIRSRYRHIYDTGYTSTSRIKKSGDSEDKWSTCNSVTTWYGVLKRDNTSMNHWRILVRRVGTAEGYRMSSFTPPVPSLHRHLHEINTESSSIVQGNNSNNNNNKRKCKFDHTQSLWQKIGIKSKILTWHISAIWSEIPLLYRLPLIFQ